MVFLMILSDVRTPSNVYIMKKSKLWNNTSSKVLLCSTLIPIFRSVAAFACKLNKNYHVPFKDARVVESGKDLKYSNVIRSSSESTYDHCIRIIRLCMEREDFILVFDELNEMKLLT